MAVATWISTRPTYCMAGDSNHDDKIEVNQIIQAVKNLLQGCST